MVNYDYRCGTDGLVQSSHPMGTAPAQISCPHCAGTATRSYSAPAVGTGRRPVDAMLAMAGASADRPGVVRTERSTVRTTRSQDPRWSRLPRP